MRVAGQDHLPPKMAPFLGVLLFVFLIMVLISSAAPKYFEFHDNFWMNLHHTLFREAVTAKMSTEARAKLGVSPPLSEFRPFPRREASMDRCDSPLCGYVRWPPIAFRRPTGEHQ